MRALQILFLITFAILVLVTPFLGFSMIQGGGNTALIIFVAVIFAINAFFIGRKVLSLKKSK